MKPDDIALFDKEGNLFRFMPRHKSVLKQPRMVAWVQTMIDEFAVVETDPDLAYKMPFFLEDKLDKYSKFSVFDLEPSERETDVSLDACESRCLEKPGCTGFSTWGLHECSYYIQEPIVLYS